MQTNARAQPRLARCAADLGRSWKSLRAVFVALLVTQDGSTNGSSEGRDPTRRPPRVAILHQGFVPDYRVRFFELLAGLGGVEYVVWHGDAPPGAAHRAVPGPFRFPNRRVGSHVATVFGRTLVYQPLARAVSTGPYDAVIVGAELKLVSNAAVFLLAKARGWPVLLWGQGADKREDTGRLLSTLARFGSGVKRGAARTADGYLVYTAGGRESLISQGVSPGRIFVVRNTLDVESEVRAQRTVATEDPASIRRRLGLQRDSAVLLFVGRMYSEKRVPALVRLVKALQQHPTLKQPVEAILIGHGPDRGAAEAEAASATGVRFLGEVRDRQLIARCMKVASALVIPGKVGLAVNHAFAHGLPVITCAGPMHAPEFEYIDPGRNGLVADGGPQLFKLTERFLTTPAQQERLRRGALATRDRLALEPMVREFHHGVLHTLGTRSGSRVEADSGP